MFKKLCFIILLFFCMVGTASAVTEISSSTTFPYTMSTAGEKYVLTENITSSAGALLVRADNVTFDGNGHTITWGTSGSAAGFDIYAATGCNVNNVHLIGGAVAANGFLLRSGSTGCTIENVSVYSKTGYGYYISSSNGNTLTNCTGESDSNNGIYVYIADNNIFTGCIGISNTSTGIRIYDAENDTFSDCTATSRTGKGLYMSNAAARNEFDNVTCESEILGIYIDRGCYDNAFSGTTVRSSQANTEIRDGYKHLMILGDSITYGLVSYFGDDANETLNANADYVVSNAGVSGETSHECVQRLPQMLDIYNPNQVTILIGTNDIGDIPQQDTINNVLEIANVISSSGATPYIMTLIPRSNVNSDVINLNIALLAQAKAAGYQTINTYDAMDSVPLNSEYDAYVDWYYSDGLHPNAEGCALLGQYIGSSLGFHSSSRSGTSPFTTQFTDNSLNGVDSWQWDFENDGVIDSTQQNPVHTYTRADNYSVNLTVTNEYDTFSTVIENYITVTNPPFASDPVAWLNWVLSYLRFW